MKILSVNAGSSSLKFQAYEMPEEKVLISGYVEKIGLSDSFWTIKINGEKIKKQRFLKDHTEAVGVLIDELLNNHIVESLEEIKGIGHRIAHGGNYKDSAIINDKVISDITDLIKLGPLHHPGHLAGINAMKKALPDTMMVAVFDTAFHQSMPSKNYMMPLPYEWYEKYDVRKYGFHGTSHKYIMECMQEKLGKGNVNLIVCHIGSGASISCIKEGKCYDTTMGLTPLGGLMMGTRCGNIDPSVIEYVTKEAKMSVEEVNQALNKTSGLLGISGYSDCRDVEEAVSRGEEKAILAMDMYNDRIAKYIAEYYLELEGNVDALVFTAGVGENGIMVRESVVDILKPLGILLDKEKNSKIASYKEEHEGLISLKDSKVDIYVIPTDEEVVIARDTYKFVTSKN